MKKEKIEKKHKMDKGQIFIKITAGFLAFLMVIAVAASLIFALMVY